MLIDDLRQRKESCWKKMPRNSKADIFPKFSKAALCAAFSRITKTIGGVCKGEMRREYISFDTANTNLKDVCAKKW